MTIRSVLAHRCAIVCALATSIGCFAEEGPGGNGDETSTTGSSTTTGATTSTAGSASGGSGEVDATTIEPGSSSSAQTGGTDSQGGSENATSDATSADSSGSGGPVCGNGLIEPPEECDDNNVGKGDGCHSDCTVYKAVFLTAAVPTGTSIGSLDGAHQICILEAEAAGLSGDFRAWLSTTQLSASTELVHSDIPYRLVDGTLVASNWTDLTDGVLTTQIDLFATGDPAGAGDERVWTGTGLGGESTPPNCGNWAGGAPNGRVGRVNWNIADDWTDLVDDPCNMQRHLYCFEQ